MKDLIIRLAYFFQGSKRYYAVKHFVYQILEDNSSLKKRYFDFIMIFIVLSTIAIMIYEVNHKPMEFLTNFETVAVFIFIIEWLLRFWVTSHIHKDIIEDYERFRLINQQFDIKKSLKKVVYTKLAYIFSPMSIIDLLAILPYYRPLRILRIFMLFRLFKILRYSNSLKQFRDVFQEKRFEFFTLSIMFVTAIIFGSTIMFIYEGNGVNQNVDNFFDAVYWSVITISTVGFGDISPVSTPGRIVTIFLVLGGMSVIAFFTSIVTAALNSRLELLKGEKVINEANRIKDFVIICGYGRMGKVLVDEFIKVKQKFIVIDYDEKAFDNMKSKHILAIKGDATDPTFLLSLGVNKGASTIVALTNNDAVNLSIILTARSHNKDITIISRANDDRVKNKLLLAGANKIISANSIASIIASEYIGKPIAFEAIEDILFNSNGAIIDQISILENSKFIGKKLETINFVSLNITLIGVVKSNDENNFIFNPKKDEYIISLQDILIVIGHKEMIEKMKIDILSGKLK